MCWDMGLCTNRGQVSAGMWGMAFHVDWDLPFTFCRCWELHSGPLCSASTLVAEPARWSWIPCSVFNCLLLLYYSLIASNSRSQGPRLITHFYENPLIRLVTTPSVGSGFFSSSLVNIALFGHGEREQRKGRAPLSLSGHRACVSACVSVCSGCHCETCCC